MRRLDAVCTHVSVHGEDGRDDLAADHVVIDDENRG